MEYIIYQYTLELMELTAAKEPDLKRIMHCLNVMEGISNGSVELFRCDLREPELSLVG